MFTTENIHLVQFTIGSSHYTINAEGPKAQIHCGEKYPSDSSTVPYSKEEAADNLNKGHWTPKSKPVTVVNQYQIY